MGLAFEADDVRNPQYDGNGNVLCEINHPEFGWIPFTATPDDPVSYGPAIYQYCLDIGPADHVPPVLTPLHFSLKPYQFHAMLDILGVTDAVNAAINAIADPAEKAVARAKMNHMSEYERNDPLFSTLAPVVGLTDSEIDAAWMQAKDL